MQSGESDRQKGDCAEVERSQLLAAPLSWGMKPFRPVTLRARLSVGEALVSAR